MSAGATVVRRGERCQSGGTRHFSLLRRGVPVSLELAEKNRQRPGRSKALCTYYECHHGEIACEIYDSIELNAHELIRQTTRTTAKGSNREKEGSIAACEFEQGVWLNTGWLAIGGSRVDAFARMPRRDCTKTCLGVVGVEACVDCLRLLQSEEHPWRVDHESWPNSYYGEPAKGAGW